MKLQRFFSYTPVHDLPSFVAAVTGRPFELEVSAKTWYNFRNAAKDVAEVAIYDYIGAYGVSASDFLQELNEITAPNLNVRINSPGGEVSSGLAIYNALKRYNGIVSVFVDGMAASAASFIAQAAAPGRLFMSPHAEMLIHDGLGLCMGPSADMRKMADWLDMTSDNIAAIYAGRAGGTVKAWRSLMVDETLYSDQGAIDAKLADAISADGEAVTTPPPPDQEEIDDLKDFDIAAALREQLPQEDQFDYAKALREAVASS